MGQLANSLSEMEEEESPNQSIVNLEDQFKIEANSHSEQAEPITLRNDNVVEYLVGEPDVIHVQEDDGETQSTIEHISMSPESSTSAFVRHESIPAHIPRAPFWQRLTESTGEEDSLHEHKEIILAKNVRSLPLVNVDTFLFPLDCIVMNTQLVTNLISQLPEILGRPFFSTSNAVIHCRSGQLELSSGTFKVILSIIHDGNHPPEIDDFGSIQIFHSPVSDCFPLISYPDPLRTHLEHCGIYFNEDTSVREFKTLLDFIPLMDVTNAIAKRELLLDDWTYNLPKEPPIFDIKRWPP